MNFFKWRRTEDVSLQEHDRRHHGGRFDPDTMSCGLRREMKIDDLHDGKKESVESRRDLSIYCMADALRKWTGCKVSIVSKERADKFISCVSGYTDDARFHAAAMSGNGRLVSCPDSLRESILGTDTVTFPSSEDFPSDVKERLVNWRTENNSSSQRELAKAIFKSLKETECLTTDGRKFVVTWAGIDKILSHVKSKSPNAIGKVAFALGIVEFMKKSVPFYTERKNGTQFMSYACNSEYSGQDLIGLSSIVVGTDGVLGLKDTNAINKSTVGSNQDGHSHNENPSKKNSHGLNTNIIAHGIMSGQWKSNEDFDCGFQK